MGAGGSLAAELTGRPLREGPSPAAPAGRARHVARWLLAAGLLLAARLLTHFWRVFLLLLGLIGLIGFGVLPELPLALHIGALLGIGVALITFLRKGLRKFPPLRAGDVDRALERAGGIPHRPLDALADRLAQRAPNGTLRALWQEHQRRAAAALARLRLPAVTPEWNRLDPYSLRFVLLGFAALGVVYAGPDFPSRARHGLIPALPGLSPAAVPITAWLTPPEWAGQGVIPLTLGTAPEPVPAGTRLHVRMPDAPRWQRPRLWLEENHQPEKIVAAQRQGAVWLGRADLTTPATLRVEGGAQDGARWDIPVRANQPPTIRFSRPPEAAANAHIRFGWEASDDFGLKAVRLLLRPVDDDPLGLAETSLRLPLPATAPRQAGETAHQDLTAHPYAGRVMRLVLIAEDAAGLRAATAEQRLTLPQRAFRHPLARRIMDQRAALIAEPLTRRTEVAEDFARLAASAPEAQRDPVLLMGLRMAALRLVLDRDPQSTFRVLQLLWQLAVRLEDGGLAAAEDRFAAARAALERALAAQDGAGALQEILAELESSFADFLSQLQTQMAQSAPMDPLLAELFPPGRVIADSELARRLQDIKERVAAGDLAGAKKALAELQEMMAQLNGANPQASGPPPPALEDLKALRALAREQQALRDATWQRGQPNSGPSAAPGESAGPQTLRLPLAQQALRDQLAQRRAALSRHLGTDSAALAQADAAMAQAHTHLQQNALPGALTAQGKALEALRAAFTESAEKLRAQMQAAGNMPGGVVPFGSGGSGDPFGRSTSGGNDPDAANPLPGDAARVREIYEELRRRVGDRSRSPEERKYLERLLERF